MDDGVFAREPARSPPTLEPVIGQVFFSPECHAAYEKLGFAPSPGTFGNGVAAPDGPGVLHEPRVRCSARSSPKSSRRRSACSSRRSSSPGVRSAGRSPTRRRSSRRGAPARSRNSNACCGPAAGDVTRAAELLERAVEPLAEPGRPLFAGLRARWDDPADPWTRLFHLGDMLRECRGDAHVCAWIDGRRRRDRDRAAHRGVHGAAAAHLHPDAGMERRRARRRAVPAHAIGAGSTATGSPRSAGANARRWSERPTAAMTPAIGALGDDVDEVIAMLRPWGERCARRAATSAGPSTSGRIAN